MPEYHLACSAADCDAEFGLTQSIKAPLPTRCPACGADTLRTIQYPATILDLTPRTLGTLAERNSGGTSYWLDARRHEAAESRRRGADEIDAGLPAGMKSARPAGDARPWWRGETINTKLTELSETQQANYVATGDPNG